MGLCSQDAIDSLLQPLLVSPNKLSKLFDELSNVWSNNIYFSFFTNIYQVCASSSAKLASEHLISHVSNLIREETPRVCPNRPVNNNEREVRELEEHELLKTISSWKSQNPSFNFDFFSVFFRELRLTNSGDNGSLLRQLLKVPYLSSCFSSDLDGSFDESDKFVEGFTSLVHFVAQQKDLTSRLLLLATVLSLLKPNSKFNNFMSQLRVPRAELCALASSRLLTQEDLSRHRRWLQETKRLQGLKTSPLLIVFSSKLVIISFSNKLTLQNLVNPSTIPKGSLSPGKINISFLYFDKRDSPFCKAA